MSKRQAATAITDLSLQWKLRKLMAGSDFSHGQPQRSQRLDPPFKREPGFLSSASTVNNARWIWKLGSYQVYFLFRRMKATQQLDGRGMN